MKISKIKNFLQGRNYSYLNNRFPSPPPSPPLPLAPIYQIPYLSNFSILSLSSSFSSYKELEYDIKTNKNDMNEKQDENIKEKIENKQLRIEKENKSDRSEIIEKLLKINYEKISSPPCKNEIVLSRVFQVYDGDTVKVIYPYGKEFIKISIRLIGIDTPELILRRYKNEKIKNLHEKAGFIVKKHVESLILEKIILLKILKWDKYGGRIVGDILVPYSQMLEKIENKNISVLTIRRSDENNYFFEREEEDKFVSLSDYLISEKLAKVYSGKVKKNEWSEDDLKYIIGNF